MSMVNEHQLEREPRFESRLPRDFQHLRGYTCRILLVDHHEIVRCGLRQILSECQGWEVCGEAKDGREAVRLTAQLKPDVVVLDLMLPELNGLEATRQIRRSQCQTEVLVLSLCETEELIREALAAGARGYVLKSEPVYQIISAVEALSHHKPHFTGIVSRLMLETFLKSESNQKKRQSVEVLTAREREIVQMLAEGYNNKTIATHLSISVKTVETHRSTVMRKLDINSIVALVHYAIRNQIVAA